jgi:hypothetical protein
MARNGKGKEVKIGIIVYKSMEHFRNKMNERNVAKGKAAISYTTFYQRIAKGMTPTEAVNTPVRAYNVKVHTVAETVAEPVAEVATVEATAEQIAA